MKPLESTFSWEHKAGAFELLENGELDEASPEFTRLQLPEITRGLPSQLNPAELSARWKNFIKHLKRFKKEEILFERQPVLIPLIKLYVPPKGSAVLKYTKSSDKKAGPEISFLGIGFGSTDSIHFRDTVEIPAEKRGKLIQVVMNATAIRYRDKNSDEPLVRVDLEEVHGPKVNKIDDLPESGTIDITGYPNSGRWKIIQEILLSSVSDRGQYTLQYELSERANWKVGLVGGPFQAIGINLSLAVEVERSNEFELTFKMPYGHDYVFYGPNDESPIVPMCTIKRN